MRKLVIKKDAVFLVTQMQRDATWREAYWRPAKETEASVNSSEYTLFTQSPHAWSVKIVLWSVKSQGIFFILMGGNPAFCLFS